MRLLSTLLLCTFILACSGTPHKDYDAIARCGDLGYKSGDAGFDNCVNNEIAAARLARQREEFDQMREAEKDRALRRF